MLDDMIMYDEYRMPPNWKVAQDHGKAVKAARPPYSSTWNRNKSLHEQIICPCCFKYIEKKPVPYFEDTKDLAFLGVGFPLFYNFMRLCLLLLASLIVDSCVLSIIMNLNENDCRKFENRPQSVINIQCQGDLMLKLSYVDIEHPNLYRNAIKILSFCVTLIVLLYIRKEQNNMTDYLEERNTLINQFALILDGIPRGSANNKQLIRRIIEDENSEEPLEVKEIILIENLNEFLDLKTKIDSTLKQQQKYYNKPKCVEKWQQAKVDSATAIYELEQLKWKMAVSQEKYFIGTAIVIMNTESDKMNAIKMINRMPDGQIKKFYPNYSSREGKVRASCAPPPLDIIWENIHYSKSVRFLAWIIGWIVSILVLVFVTIGVFFIIKEKSELINESHDSSDTDVANRKQSIGILLSYGMIVFISIFNKFIMSWVFHSICNNEKHYSYSDLQFSFALKYTLGMFFTTALMTLMVEAIIFHNYSEHGIIEEQLVMAIFSAFFSPIVYLINPQYIMKKIKVKLHYGDKNLTQAQANLLMEQPEYDLGKRYAEVMKVMWFTMLYNYLMPVAAVISFIGIVGYYFVDKFVLLRRSSVKQSISLELSRKIFKMLEISLILQPAGEILFDMQIRNRFSIESVVMLGIAIVYQILPIDWLLSCIFKHSYMPEKLTYDEAKIYFQHFYSSCYPIRKVEALNDLIEADFEVKRHRIIKHYTSRFLNNEGGSEEEMQRHQKKRTFLEMEEVQSTKLLELPKLQIRPILKQPKLINR